MVYNFFISIFILLLYANTSTFAAYTTKNEFTISQSGDILTFTITPFPRDIRTNYQLWWEARKKNPGDRLGKREYWKHAPIEEYSNILRYEYCKKFWEQRNFHFTLNLNPSLDLSKKLEQWESFQCLVEDFDSFILAFPKIEAAIKSRVYELKQLRDYINSIRYGLVLGEHEREFNAENTLSTLLDAIYTKPGRWIRNETYRNALQHETLESFNKKIYAGDDPPIQKPLILVAHANYFDSDMSIKNFSDTTIALAKIKGLPIIYLM